MIAYKGLHADLTCTLGQGSLQYAIGQTIRENRSECASKGMHCTEYPLECFLWYPLESGNRYFEVEASGSIDECGEDAKIACTELTLVRELTVFQMAALGMMYMVEHPFRDWETHAKGCAVQRDSAIAYGRGNVAIARGDNPKVRGVQGAILGLVREERGEITDAKIFRVGGNVKPGIWYTLDERELKEAEQ